MQFFSKTKKDTVQRDVRLGESGWVWVHTWKLTTHVVCIVIQNDS